VADGKNPNAVALAKRRAVTMPPERRSESARNAANARWAQMMPGERSVAAKRAAQNRRKPRPKKPGVSQKGLS